MSKLEGRVAIVTGAAQGIGAVYAKALAEAGARVAVTDILDPEPVVAQIKADGGTAIGVLTDVSKAASVKAMVEATARSLGDIDILINNAAIFGQLSKTAITDISSDDWDKVMSVNIRGTFECCKAVIPGMKARKYGKIVNITSSTVFIGQPMLLHYVTSKGAIVAMTRAMARELGEYKICVNSLAPGFTMSEAVRKFDPARIQANATNRAFRQEQLPEDLIGSLIFLSSTDSDFMTGQTMVVDGGHVMH